VPIDTMTPTSPGWWLQRLIKQLAARRARYDLLDAYYTGRAEIPVHANKSLRQSYQRLMSVARTNFAELVVEAVRERMVPVGFRTGADGDELGDKEAWRIWQANALDADSPLLFRSSLALSMGYMIVGGIDDEIGAPLITPEDPREVIAVRDPIRRRKTVAALKVFVDDVEGVERAFVYLPGIVHRAVRALAPEGTEFRADVTGWEWEESSQLPAPVVPVVAFPNRDSLVGHSGGDSWGEFETHLAVLDRINYKKLNELEIASLQAFRQRAIKGVPLHDEAGNEIDYDDIFSGDPGALWHLPETAELWESGQVDLGPLRLSIRDDIQDLAAVTRTPLFYLTPEAANGSAEGAALAREGLVFKTQDRILQASESLERVMQLAFLFAKDEDRANAPDMEVIWMDPQRFSLSERADAASKAIAGGMPWRSVMRDIWQRSPQELERMETERAADAFLAATVAPAVPDGGQ
jgi:hypothetical protein